MEEVGPSVEEGETLEEPLVGDLEEVPVGLLWIVE